MKKLKYCRERRDLAERRKWEEQGEIMYGWKGLNSLKDILEEKLFALSLSFSHRFCSLLQATLSFYIFSECGFFREI